MEGVHVVGTGPGGRNFPSGVGAGSKLRGLGGTKSPKAEQNVKLAYNF